MYHIAICDDEKKILSDLHQKIKKSFEQDNLTAEYICMEDSRKLMEYLAEGKPDVLFLDIDMPYFSGMDIAGYVNEQGLHTILVFVTSHDALVYQTFAYRPFGFLRKTHIGEELDALVKRIHKELIENKQELVIQKGQEITRIRISEIVYIEAEGNYLVVHQLSDTLRLRYTMTGMEQELGSKGFIRCHKGYLINPDYIEKLRSAEVQMKFSGESRIIPIGRSYEKEVRQKIVDSIRN